MSREWDALTYDRVALPHHQWAGEVLDRLALAGDETLLDAGCGSGTLTFQALARLERGRVVAVDGSARMIDQARRRLATHRHRVRFVHADLSQPLPVEPVDVVVSSATFHWIADHRTLFANLAGVLRPGGRLSAQCGGAGNVASVQRALSAAGFTGADPWHFASPGEARAALEAAGFADTEAWLTPAPAPIPDGDREDYLASVVLGAHLDQVPADERAHLVAAVARHLPGPDIDYVRLNLVARLP